MQCDESVVWIQEPLADPSNNGIILVRVYLQAESKEV